MQFMGKDTGDTNTNIFTIFDTVQVMMWGQSGCGIVGNHTGLDVRNKQIWAKKVFPPKCSRPFKLFF